MIMRNIISPMLVPEYLIKELNIKPIDVMILGVMFRDGATTKAKSNMKPKEVAQVLNISQSTVRRSIKRMKNKGAIINEVTL